MSDLLAEARAQRAEAEREALIWCGIRPGVAHMLRLEVLYRLVAAAKRHYRA